MELHNALATWSCQSELKNTLKKLRLKIKITKNKFAFPYVEYKNSFEGSSAKIIPVTQGKDIIYYVMGGYNKSTREGSTQNFWVNLRTEKTG